VTIPARRTYLEMRRPDALRPARTPLGAVEIRREDPCEAALYRALYRDVGRDYRWTDRASWSDAEVTAHLAQPGVEVWVARVGADLAGYFELRACEDGSIEIAYFGLLPGFTGRGLGGWLATEAVRRAWAGHPTRVWLHTCTLDHPAALPNYLSRGFAVTRVEDYDAV
jgi:GNAT superfamily N-acetyltransferase